MSINAVEGFPLEDFNIENVRSQIAEAQKIAGGSGSEQDIAEAKVELEVRLQHLIYVKLALMWCRFWKACRLLSSKGAICRS